jgi:hypothetical protein
LCLDGRDKQRENGEKPYQQRKWQSLHGGSLDTAIRGLLLVIRVREVSLYHVKLILLGSAEPRDAAAHSGVAG